MTVHSERVATNFEQRRCLTVAKVIIMSWLGAVTGTTAVVVVDDYFIRAV